MRSILPLIRGCIYLLLTAPLAAYAQTSLDIPMDSFTSGIEVDGEIIPYNSRSTQQSHEETPFGPADKTLWIGETDEFTHTISLLHLNEYGGAYIATHSILFKADVGIDGITGFTYKLPNNGDTRIAYGPADNTSYQIEDTIDIPAIPGYSKPGNMIFGGVPFNYVWNKNRGMYVGVLAAQPDSFELPINVSTNATTLEHLYFPDGDIGAQTDFVAGETLTLPSIMVGFHQGDYFTPLRNYTRVLEISSQKQYIDVPLGNASAPDPYWKTWGLDKNLNGDFSVEQILDMTDILAARGIYRILLDYGWFVTEGVWEANEDPGFSSDDDLVALVDELDSRGFELGLWYQPLQIDIEDEDVEGSLMQYAILDEDGDVFIDDDDLALLDPSNEHVQNLVQKHMAMFEEWGIKHIYLDSQMAQLATPPNHALSTPLASHQALPRLYDLIRAEGRNREITVEICPDGRQQTLLNMPQAVTNIGDPNNDRQLRAEHRWLTAIQGSRAIIGTYIETFPDNGTSGSFLNIAGIGGNMQSIGDPDNLQNPEWDIWMQFHNEHNLVTADYLPLYDIAFDAPETHVLQRGNTLYYSLFSKTDDIAVCMQNDCIDASVEVVEKADPAAFSQEVELRGLQAGASYKVQSFPDNSPHTTVQANMDGVATLRISFEKELMLIVTKN